MSQYLFDLQDIPDDQCKEFELGEQACFAVKHDGQLFLYRNHCPHLGIALNWQEDEFLDPDKVLIQCSTHGALFQIADGRCVSGPCLGKALTAIDYRVEADKVYVD